MFLALGGPESDVVFPWRSFDAYPRLITACGCRPVPVPLRDGRNDLAALASLSAKDALAERVAGTVAERRRLWEALRDRGWDVPESEGNFLWLGARARSEVFAAHCAGSGIAVKAFPDEGVRVTVGTREAGDAFLAAVDAWA